ncbi:hypothetical protein EKO04_000417 [Ascochyta lentis]|uniref:Uncharacterized protein n=1 Tax=Ascochyta lentis TaxID=205686 RepID=A0A8H7JDN2_9PLEO|nr:hypothetical protein EKO04_000417 [Ascochyta lentis]
MRTPLLSVLGAFLGLHILSTHANVICTGSQYLDDNGVPTPKPAKALHESLHRPNNGACDADFSDVGFSTYRTESTVFTITGTDQNENLESCEDSFNAIIRQCIEEKNVHGGTLLTNGPLLKPAKPVKPAKPQPKPAKPQPAKPPKKACPLKPQGKGKGKGGKLTSRDGSDCEEEVGLEKIWGDIPGTKKAIGDSALHFNVKEAQSDAWGITYLHDCTGILISDPKFVIVAHMQEDGPGSECIMLADAAQVKKYLQGPLQEAIDQADPTAKTQIHILYTQPKVGRPLLSEFEKFFKDEWFFEGKVNKIPYFGGSGTGEMKGLKGKAAIQVIGGKGKGKNKLKVFWNSDTPIRNESF